MSVVVSKVDCSTSQSSLIDVRNIKELEVERSGPYIESRSETSIHVNGSTRFYPHFRYLWQQVNFESRSNDVWIVAVFTIFTVKMSQQIEEPYDVPRLELTSIIGFNGNSFYIDFHNFNMICEEIQKFILCQKICVPVSQAPGDNNNKGRLSQRISGLFTT